MGWSAWRTVLCPPRVLLLLALTMGYAALGVTPIMRGALYGLGPVVLGIHLVAVYRLGMAPHALPDVFAAATLHAHARHGVVSHVLNPAVR